MRHTTIISGHRGTHHTVFAAVGIIAGFWIIAAIVAMLALGGGLTRLAVVLAVVATEWWLVSEIEDRFEMKCRGKRGEDGFRDPSSPSIDRSTRPEKDFGTRVMAWP